MSDTKPEHGEVWQDSEGCLLTIAGEEAEHVFAMGHGERLLIEDMRDADKPVSRVFDVEGNYVGTGPLTYPGGSNIFRRPSLSPFTITTSDANGVTEITTFIL